MVTEEAVTTKPRFRRLGDSYQFAWPTLGVEIELDRLHEARGGDGLSAEIAVYNTQPPGDGLLHSARFNLLATKTRSDLAQALFKRASDIGLEVWSDILEHVCFMTVSEYREGDPTIVLADVDWRTRQRWLLKPFIEQGMGTVLFAKGGSGKSVLGLAMAVSVCTGVPLLGTPVGEPVGTLLLDWEADAGAHAERLEALCKGARLPMPRNLYYRRPTATLIEAAYYLRKEVARLNIGFVIIDAASAAAGGESNEERAVQGLFQAARSLKVSFLVIDHLAKTSNDPTMPIGHSQKAYQARQTWSVEKVQEEGDARLTVALVNQKRNQGPMQRRRGYRIDFDNDEATEETQLIRLQEIDMTTVPALSAKLPLKQRILAELRTGKFTIEDLAESLQAKPDQVRVRLNELRVDGKVIRMEKDWGLAYVG